MQNVIIFILSGGNMWTYDCFFWVYKKRSSICNKHAGHPLHQLLQVSWKCLQNKRPSSWNFRSPWAATLQDEERHMRTQKLVGESMRGKDHRILALLYTLAFYAMTDLEFSEVDLSRDDKEIINYDKFMFLEIPPDLIVSIPLIYH